MEGESQLAAGGSMGILRIVPLKQADGTHRCL